MSDSLGGGGLGSTAYGGGTYTADASILISNLSSNIPSFIRGGLSLSSSANLYINTEASPNIYSGFGTKPYGATDISLEGIPSKVSAQIAFVLCTGDLVSSTATYVHGHENTNTYDYEAKVLADNPAAYYKIDGTGPTLLDSSGNNNHSTGSSGSLTWQEPAVASYVDEDNHAGLFNGDYFNIPRSIGSVNFSIEFWIRTTWTAPSGTHWYNGVGIVDGEVGGVANDFGVSMTGSQIAFGIGNSDKTIKSGAINDGKPHHVVCTRNSSTGAMKIYVDSALVATATGPTGSRTAPGGLRIGSLWTGVNGTLVNVTLDEIALYNKELGPSSVSNRHLPTYPSIVKHAFTNGALAGNDSQNAFVNGHYAVEVQPQHAMIRSVGEVMNGKPVYVHGDRFVTDSVRRCYMDSSDLGPVRMERFTQLIFVNGTNPPSITKNKPCYIVWFGIIGEWNLNDGPDGENVRFYANDDSYVDNDARLLNYPTWVEGPHCGDGS